MADLGSQACIYRDKAVLVKFSSNETGFYDVYRQKDRKREKSCALVYPRKSKFANTASV